MLINSAGQVVVPPKRFHNHEERAAFLAPLREVQEVRESTGPMFSLAKRARNTLERPGDERKWTRADLSEGWTLLTESKPRKSALHWQRNIRQEARRKARHADPMVRKGLHG